MIISELTPSFASYKRARARDLFCFMCFTGMRVSDLQNLKRENIKDGQIFKTIVKTHKTEVIPLNQYAKSILARYDYDEDRVLPKLSVQKINDHIKESCEEADQCNPIILPEITFLNQEGKHIIKVQIFKGSNPPYYLKNKGFEEGTFIRVGSYNRLASPEMIDELKRQMHSTSFDSVISFEKLLMFLNSFYSRQIFLKKRMKRLLLQF